jgi:outer membrane protein assembly factor BamB
VNGSQLTELWASDEALSNHYATSVHHQGVLYGFHGRQEFGPTLRAVDLKTGAVKWDQDQFRAGSILLAGDRLVILRESGELVLAPATPEAFKPLARAQILQGTVARPYPALADGILYARNENTLVAVDLR